jgi:hypothetical protein
MTGPAPADGPPASLRRVFGPVTQGSPRPDQGHPALLSRPRNRLQGKKDQMMGWSA